MYQKIIVPVDCAQTAKGAESLAKARALLESGGEIILLSVLEPIPAHLTLDFPYEITEVTIEESKAKIEKLKERAAPSAKVELRMGSPAHEILEAAKTHGADLIIIASHIPDFSNYLLGATADRVVRHAGCSVLVTR